MRFWHRWRGGTKDAPVLQIRRLLRWRGWRLDLHRINAADPAGCFHTHPAKAWRLILWGGYVEQQATRWAPTRLAWVGNFVRLRTFFPGRLGFVAPRYCHRVHALRTMHSSYSLWLRGPVTAPIRLVGPGWPQGTTRVFEEDNDA